MPVISCENLCVKYGGEDAVCGVSFTLEQADYLCVVGENGSGKTTLMKALLGIVKPTSGEIRLDNAAKHETGYLPQLCAERKNFPASVREVVLSGRTGARGLLPFYTKADRQRASDNMKRLGIHALRRKPYAELSGGEQRRVLLARALCAAEQLLILDEPAAGLDPVAASEMYAAIDELNRRGVAIIMVTHDVGALTRMSRAKILHLRTSPIFYGTASEFAKTEAGRALIGGGGNA